jgi:biotin carboxyl carrier protein
MQGTILDVKVKVGDMVKEGDVLLILEAMKLENEIKAPFGGKVVDIKVSKGQSVNAKEVLVVLG